MKFMIVDDSAFSVMMIRDILEQNGYNVVATAGNKEEMLHVFKETTPDLVTMDLTMPDIDGLESVTASIATEFGEATLNVGFAGSGR